MNVQGTPVAIESWKEYGRHLVYPFIGKGSPEECDFVLQLATLVGGVAPDRLKTSGWTATGWSATTSFARF